MNIMARLLVSMVMVIPFRQITLGQQGYLGLAINGTSSQDYFPLTKGNTWTYAPFYDSTRWYQASILDTTRVNGQLYWQYSGTVYPAYRSLLRCDSLGDILQFANGLECMLFCFSGVCGYAYAFIPYPTSIIYVRRNIEISVPAGRFTDCISCSFIGSFADDNVEFVFAPGVGMVKYGGPFYVTSVLVRAFINGKIISSVKEFSDELPSKFSLGQNFSNPFNPTTVISFQLPVASQVRLVVFDLLGREVATLVNETKPAGVHTVQFDASGLASGVYLYRIQAGSFVQTRKLVLLR